MTYVVIFFPLIVILGAFLLFPVRVERFLNEGETIRSVSAERRPEVKGMLFRWYWTTAVICFPLAALVMGLQYLLWRLGHPEGGEADEVFVYRFLDSAILHLLPSLFVAGMVGGLLSYHLSARRGRESMRSLLFCRDRSVPFCEDSGLSMWRQMQWTPVLAVVFAVAASLANVLMAGVHFRVDQTAIRYRKFFEIAPSVVPVGEVRRVSTYRRRTDAFGNLRDGPYAEMELADGTIVDLPSEVTKSGKYRKGRLQELIEALAEVCPEETVFEALDHKKD